MSVGYQLQRKEVPIMCYKYKHYLLTESIQYHVSIFYDLPTQHRK